MKTIRVLLAIALATSLFSCGNRSTDKEEGEIRLEEGAPDNNMETDTEKAISNEDMAEISEAKTVMNDYYNAMTDGKAREAFDAWNPETNTKEFSEFQAESPDFKEISVSYPEGAQVTKNGEKHTVTLPIRISGSKEDGESTSSSGTVTLMKDNGQDNAQYMVESIDIKVEDS